MQAGKGLKPTGGASATPKATNTPRRALSVTKAAQEGLGEGARQPNTLLKTSELQSMIVDSVAGASCLYSTTPTARA